MSAQTEKAPEAQQKGHHAHGFRRKMVGKVVRPNKKNAGGRMDKTVVVEVVTHSPDALYGKYVRSRHRYKAHDEQNQYLPGDEVEIQEHAPMSRSKRFIVVRLIKKFVQE
ncbi:MAG TPA: 30S ribosomal protein S17 [Polyangiaceae bacterium]|jgi:small subunit ribosomal protein S17